MSAEPLAGVLLCKAGQMGLAFVASQVMTITPVQIDDTLPTVRSLLGLEPVPGRALISDEGRAVGVDSVQVCQERLTLLPAPAMTAHGWGKSLAGFVLVQERLWPVYRLAELARYLAEARSSAHGAEP